ncbi:MAG: TadE/TadG family type IV pilus assembly protein [Sphingorhabdus sp.]
MWSIAGSLWRNESGAIAATYALALPALIAVGGIAFDYARLAAMDTELQNAADQAALAAVTQLDQTPTSCSRAVAAARTLIANRTLFANDGDAAGRNVAIADQTANSGCGTASDRIKFYSSYTSATNNTVTTDPLMARFVSVTVNTRKAVYALTPIVAQFDSGNVTGSAVAGLGSAICKVPPVMICNPAEPDGNTDVNFAFNIAEGVGLKLVTGDADAPGNFGWLDTGFDKGNGTPELATSLGYNSPPGDCSPIQGVDLKTGLRPVVMDALNTRFDISAAGGNTCRAGGTCSPSRNVRKDLVRRNQCNTGNNGWQESANPYRPIANEPLLSAYPDIMGHPRDICHAVSYDGVCGTGGTASRVGSGVWDRNAYFRVNYGWNSQSVWMAATGLPANVTRYKVYEWELANPGIADMVQSTGGSRTGHSAPLCRSPGITPGGDSVDRRRISAAVLNCEALGLNGSETDVEVLEWIDLFLVEPSIQRRRGSTVVTEVGDVYVEVIGKTGSGTAGATAGQVVRRDKPYLIE